MTSEGYLIIKSVHLSAAAMTYVLFFIRGLWMMAAPHWLTHLWVRVVPHVIDTVLLGSAIGLMWITHQYPGFQTWLTVKILALLVYIGLGMTAFRIAKTRRVRVVAWVSAQAVFFYIVLVAFTRSPFGMSSA